MANTLPDDMPTELLSVAAVEPDMEEAVTALGILSATDQLIEATLDGSHFQFWLGNAIACVGPWCHVTERSWGMYSALKFELELELFCQPLLLADRRGGIFGMAGAHLAVRHCLLIGNAASTWCRRPQKMEKALFAWRRWRMVWRSGPGTTVGLTSCCADQSSPVVSKIGIDVARTPPVSDLCTQKYICMSYVFA